jgi:hypothetical protein
MTKLFSFCFLFGLICFFFLPFLLLLLFPLSLPLCWCSGSALSFNHTIPHLLATGSLDKSIKLWDLTNAAAPVCVSTKRPHIGMLLMWCNFRVHICNTKNAIPTPPPHTHIHIYPHNHLFMSSFLFSSYLWLLWLCLNCLVAYHYYHIPLFFTLTHTHTHSLSLSPSLPC